MKKYIFSVFLFFPIISNASGWPDLSGVNKNDVTVYVHPAWDGGDDGSGRDYSKEENRKYYEISLHSHGKTILTTFKDQICNFKENPAKERVSFSCVKSKESMACYFEINSKNELENTSCDENVATPLSGVTYKIVPNNTDDFWSYEAEYICVSGCNIDPMTPQRMYQDHWEGSKPSCFEHRETKLKLKKLAYVRNQPSISSRIIAGYAKSSIVEIIDRDKTCRTYVFNGDLVDGQWVKVKNISDKESEEGWIFDSYVEYPETP